MTREALLAEAEKGGFFSYMAGVAFQVMTFYPVKGLEIDNYCTDMPVKKRAQQFGGGLCAYGEGF